MYEEKGQNADALAVYKKYKDLYPNDTEIDKLIELCGYKLE
jgi:hypothetical protein